MAARWLVKSEPDVYAWSDLVRDGTTGWDGVRNNAARSHLKAMRTGDRVLYYHSNADPTGVAGLARVCRTAYPDPAALDPASDYFDPKASAEDPRWFMVDIEYEATFPRVITLDDIRAEPGLERMLVINKSRLSVQPVTDEEFATVVAMAKR
jgi:predicted RNA-binding protein with PUA-like domain